MIFGIGVDIAEIARIERLSLRFGERFARRILTDDELAVCGSRRNANSYLATRFAAKEAVAKALGTGIGEQLSFHSIQIDNDAQGKPLLSFLGDAVDLISRLEISNATISLSDEKHYVVAMVVLET
ncbi:MAG: holo-ACP synthase [Gammaproteobacteria bacterium]|nr:holo-ACP synthase [Gammaproteobacteria bacterium]